jgi:hypothetical protein
VSIKEVKYLKDDAALTADTVTAEVEIRATSSTAVREGLDLVAVLDVSCRKDTAKIDNLKNAMKFVIMKLTPVDRLSIVTFSDGAARLNPLRCMTPAAQKELIAIVDGLSISARGSSGGTNIKAGLDTGLAVIADCVNTTARTPNVFLVSDGKQTVGDARVVDPGHVAVYTFGVGGDSDHQLLSDLATKSRGGMFSAVSDGANLIVALSQLLGGLLTVVAQDVQLTLTPNTDVVDTTSVVMAHYDTHTIGDGSGAITINFGTLFAGEWRKVVITLGVKDSTATQEYYAALVEAHHVFTAQGRVQRPATAQDIQIQILRSPNPSQASGVSSKARQLQAELARLAQAEAIRQARLLADAAEDLDEAKRKLVDVQKVLDDIVILDDDGQKQMVSWLHAELLQLISFMGSKDIYEAKGRPYALASEASHARQRYCTRGGYNDVRLFSTLRMDAYREQANDFEKDPTSPVPSADEDVNKEIAANPLAAISTDLTYYLRNAIESLQAIQKLISATA